MFNGILSEYSEASGTSSGCARRSGKAPAIVLQGQEFSRRQHSAPLAILSQRRESVALRWRQAGKVRASLGDLGNANPALPWAYCVKLRRTTCYRHGRPPFARRVHEVYGLAKFHHSCPGAMRSTSFQPYGLRVLFLHFVADVVHCRHKMAQH